MADFEFSQAFGSSAPLALLTRINNVDGIFSQQVGAQQISFAATSIEADRAPANNQIGVKVTVAGPVAANGGGSGAMTWWSTLLLAAAAACRRPRAASDRQRESMPAPAPAGLYWTAVNAL